MQLQVFLTSEGLKLPIPWGRNSCQGSTRGMLSRSLWHLTMPTNSHRTASLAARASTGSGHPDQMQMPEAAETGQGSKEDEAEIISQDQGGQEFDALSDTKSESNEPDTTKGTNDKPQNAKEVQEADQSGQEYEPLKVKRIY